MVNFVDLGNQNLLVLEEPLEVYSPSVRLVGALTVRLDELNLKELLVFVDSYSDGPVSYTVLRAESQSGHGNDEVRENYLVYTDGLMSWFGAGPCRCTLCLYQFAKRMRSEAVGHGKHHANRSGVASLRDQDIGLN